MIKKKVVLRNSSFFGLIVGPLDDDVQLNLEVNAVAVT